MAWKPMKGSMDGCSAINWSCCNENPASPSASHDRGRRDGKRCWCGVAASAEQCERANVSAVEGDDRKNSEGKANLRTPSSAGWFRDIVRSSSGAISARVLPDEISRDGDP